MPGVAVNPFAPPLQLGYPPALWTPAVEPSTHWWFDAQTAASLTDVGGGPINDGDTVGTWANLVTTVALVNIGQLLALGRPTYRTVGINGLPALEFAANQILVSAQTAGLQSLSGLTVFTVASVTAWPTANATTNSMWGNANLVTLLQLGGTQVPLTLRSGGRRLEADAGQGRNFVGLTLGVPFLLTSAWNYRGFLMDQYANGLYMGSIVPFQVTGDSDALVPGLFEVGSSIRIDGVVDSLLAGFVGETVGVKRYMQQTELVAAHNYFKRRWGIP